jgi:chromosome segregation ATPase
MANRKKVKKVKIRERLIGIPVPVSSGADSKKIAELEQRLNAVNSELQQHAVGRQQSESMVKQLQQQLTVSESKIKSVKQAKENQTKEYQEQVQRLKQKHSTTVEKLRMQLSLVSNVARERKGSMQNQQAEMDSLKSLIQQTTQQHQEELRVLNEQYKKALDDNRKVLDAMQQQKSNYEKELTKYTNIVGDLEIQLESKKRQIGKLLQTKDKLTLNIQAVAAQNANYNKIIHNDNQTIVKEQQQIEKLEKTNTRINEEMKAKQLEIEKRVAEIRMQNAGNIIVEQNRIATLQKELNNLRLASNECQSKLQVLQNQNTALQEENNNNVLSIKKLNERLLNSKSKAEYDTVMKNYEDLKKSSNETNDKLFDSIEKANNCDMDLRVCHENLKNKISEMEAAKSQGASKQEIERLETKAAEKYADLEKKYNEKVKAEAALKFQFASYKASYDSGIEKRVKDLDTANSKVDQLEKIMRRKDSEISQLNSKLDGIQSEFDARERSFNQKELDLQDAAYFQKELQQAISERDECIKKRSSLENEYQKLRDDYTLATELVEQHSKELNDWARKYHELNNDLKKNPAKYCKQYGDTLQQEKEVALAEQQQQLDNLKNDIKNDPGKYCGEYSEKQVALALESNETKAKINQAFSAPVNEIIEYNLHKKMANESLNILPNYVSEADNLFASLGKKGIEPPKHVASMKIETSNGAQYNIAKYMYKLKTSKVQTGLVLPDSYYMYVINGKGYFEHQPIDINGQQYRDIPEFIRYIETVDKKKIEYKKNPSDPKPVVIQSGFGRRRKSNKSVNTIKSLLKAINKYI